jgi:hypothetical protein
MAVCRYVVMVAADSDEDCAGYGIMTENSFDARSDDVEDLFGLMQGRNVTRVDTWQEVTDIIAKRKGVIADVRGVIAY